MNITKNKFLLWGGLLSCAFLSVLLATQEMARPPFKNNASGVHDASCQWNHYEEVSPTYSEHGSKEFYACCSHPSAFSFDKPEVGTINEKGSFEGNYFAELDSADARYIPSLIEGETLYDASSTQMVPNNYGFATGDTNLKVDPIYGPYCEVSNLTNTNDAVWVRPYESTGDNYGASLDVSSFKNYVFYAKTSIDVTLVVKNYNWKDLASSIQLTANKWTRIEIASSDDCKKLIDLAPAIWGPHETAFTFSISSIYGYGKKVNLFEGMDVVFDASEAQYTPLNWNISEGTTITNGSSDSTYGPYCEIDVPSSTISDAVWVKPFGSTSLENYSKVTFYVFSNQDMDTFQVRNSDYVLLVNPHAAKKGWNKVEINVGGNLTKTDDIGIAYWSHVTNLKWKITSIYASK